MDLSLIKDRFKKMSNKELQVFAENERGKISEQAVIILEKVFTYRKLDTTLFEADKAQKNAYEAGINSGTIKDTYFNNWNFALNLKINQEADEQIKLALMNRQCMEYEANNITKRLPEFGFVNTKFKGLISKSVFLGFEKWMKRIKFMPDSIVLITPILEKHTMLFLIEVDKKYKFQIHTNEGKSLIIDCTNNNDQQVFFEGVKDHFPHAHLGYNYEIKQLYEKNPADFLRKITATKYYAPLDISDFKF
jgi:hypothetical protein